MLPGRQPSMLSLSWAYVVGDAQLQVVDNSAAADMKIEHVVLLDYPATSTAWLRHGWLNFCYSIRNSLCRKLEISLLDIQTEFETESLILELTFSLTQHDLDWCRCCDMWWLRDRLFEWTMDHFQWLSGYLQQVDLRYWIIFTFWWLSYNKKSVSDKSAIIDGGDLEKRDGDGVHLCISSHQILGI